MGTELLATLPRPRKGVLGKHDPNIRATGRTISIILGHESSVFLAGGTLNFYFG